MIYYYVTLWLLMIAETVAYGDMYVDRMQMAGDGVALNMMIYHQAAASWVAGNGGAAFAGALDPDNVLPLLPGSFRMNGPWITEANAGVVLTCASGAIPGVQEGYVSASLIELSDNDPGAGRISGGIFRSGSQASLTFPAPGGCSGPAYYSRV